MGEVLVTYATNKGSTLEVVYRVAEGLRRAGDDVDVLAAGEARALEGCDAAVVGGALYLRRWHRDARALLKRHSERRAAIPLASFALGPKTLSEAEVANSRKQLDHALAGTPEITPVSVAVFGGVITPSKLRFPFNRLAATDARDWRAIEEWAAVAQTSFTTTSART